MKDLEGNVYKIIVYGIEGYFKRLCSSNIVFVDDTFKSALKLSIQM
jgi:hypothetical protein